MSVDSLHDVAGVLAKGRQSFLGVELLTDKDALVPRPETEILGRAALDLVQGPMRVIDMCCGSGNLGVAIAKLRPEARVYCADLTDGCVSLAKRNAQHAGVNVEVYQGDLFDALQGVEKGVDVIVCNPPYISTKKLETDRAELLAHEPREAFDGGPYGLSIHQRVLADAPAWLKPGGALLFEFGAGQDRQMNALFARAKVYRDLRFLSNEAGIPRACVMFKREITQ